MKCEHLKKISENINSLFSDVVDNNSSLYEKLGPFFRKEDVDTEIGIEKSLLLREIREKVVFKKERETYIKSIHARKLWEKLKEIVELANDCDCFENSHEDHVNSEVVLKIEKEITKAEISSLKERLTEREEQLKEKSESCLVKTEELSNLKVENKGSETRANIREEELEITSQELKQKEKEIKELIAINSTNKEKVRKLETAESQLEALKVLLNNQEKKVLEKEAEISFLHKQLAQYKVKDFENELYSAENELNVIAKRFEIEKKYKKELCDIYGQLVCLKKVSDKTEISIIKEKITKIEDELEAKIGEEKVREFSKQCKKFEKKRFQLEQWEQKQQQFEAYQEYRRPC